MLEDFQTYLEPDVTNNRSLMYFLSLVVGIILQLEVFLLSTVPTRGRQYLYFTRTAGKPKHRKIQ